MSGFATSAFWQALPSTALADAAVLAATYLAAHRAGRHNVIDTAWGLLFAAIAVASCLRSAGHGDPARRYLLLTLTLLWGLRLAAHLAQRSRGHGEDPATGHSWPGGDRWPRSRWSTCSKVGSPT